MPDIMIGGELVQVNSLPDVEVVYTAEHYRQEVERRILAFASRNTQINMAAAAAAGLFEADDQTAFVDALTMVQQMRDRGKELADRNDKNFQMDHYWPVPTAAAIALAERY